MRQTLNTLLNKITQGANARAFDNAVHLTNELRRMDTSAVEHVMRKAEPSIRYLIRRSRLPENLIRDVLHDALVILIKKIRDNIFDPNESAPSTYLIAIARNLIANHVRKNRKTPMLALDDAAEIPDEHIHAFIEGRERRDLLESLLGSLGNPCAHLIRLKYLEGLRDEEILSQNLTHYNTPMALRSKRSKCFQKLMELAAATKSGNKTISHSEHQSKHEKTRHESKH